jgi:very-short-patch-repair endonuclease
LRRGGPKDHRPHLKKRPSIAPVHRPPDTTTRDGIPVTSLQRTLADCARTFDDEQLEAALEHAIKESQALTDSDLENRFRRIVKDANLPQPRANQPIQTQGKVYRPDFHWPQHRLVAEIDGWAVHRARTARADDPALHEAPADPSPGRGDRGVGALPATGVAAIDVPGGVTGAPRDRKKRPPRAL